MKKALEWYVASWSTKNIQVGNNKGFEVKVNQRVKVNRRSTYFFPVHVDKGTSSSDISNNIGSVVCIATWLTVMIRWYLATCSRIILADVAWGDRGRGLGTSQRHLYWVWCCRVRGLAVLLDHGLSAQLLTPITCMDWMLEPNSRAASLYGRTAPIPTWSSGHQCSCRS